MQALQLKSWLLVYFGNPNQKKWRIVGTGKIARCVFGMYSYTIHSFMLIFLLVFVSLVFQFSENEATSDI